MKTAILVISFFTPGGSETRWSETIEALSVCHGRALELARWAATQGIRVRYTCRPASP
jgi:hypothetical protein